MPEGKHSIVVNLFCTLLHTQLHTKHQILNVCFAGYQCGRIKDQAEEITEIRPIKSVTYREFY
jgi:hypothetical protein